MASRRRECAAVVDRIRHTYGVDKEYTDPDAMETIRCNTERVGNAVVQLSDQLYSKDLHFVMELLQNAEDNAYPPGVVPCLEFVLTRDALLVLNNETGFQEGDVRALSDINRSTKKKKRGYIGKKGIGFKSVFKVSDAPEVHSNGFHIAFSRTLYGNLGMVLPTNLPPYNGSQLPSQLGLRPHQPSSACRSREPAAEAEAEAATVLMADRRQRTRLPLRSLQCVPPFARWTPGCCFSSRSSSASPSQTQPHQRQPPRQPPQLRAARMQQQQQQQHLQRLPTAPTVCTTMGTTTSTTMTERRAKVCPVAG